MPRQLSDEFVSQLRASSFWQGIRADDQLFPEIRNNAVSIYFRGAALLRNLCLQKGGIVGETNVKYVPLGPASKYVKSRLGQFDLEFAQPPAPRPLGTATKPVLDAYKAQMLAFGTREQKIIHQVCCTRENVVIDQEIKLQVPGERNDKIDLLYFDAALALPQSMYQPE